MVRIDDTGRGDQSEFLDVMRMLACKFRCQVPSKRHADEIELLEIQRIEQLEIVHHIVMEIGKTRIVARLSPSRVIRCNHTELFGPRFRKIKAIHRARAMEEDQRFALAGRVDNRLHTVDDVFFTYKPAHRRSPFATVATRGPRRGMTSSAKRVMFLTAFQCGMSATCMTLFR